MNGGSRRRAGWVFPLGLLAVLASLVASSSQDLSAGAQLPASSRTATAYEVPYGARLEPASLRRQSFDLYLPPHADTPPPLLIFVHGGFWMLPDDDYGIGPGIAQSLADEDVAVALVRYRLAPGSHHPVPARDIAAATARLIRDARRYGYDPERVFLVGHSAGAHLAALVALDGRYLEKHGLAPEALRGVIAISGLYDLSRDMPGAHRAAVTRAFSADARALDGASPVRHVRPDAPPFLILTAADDLPGFRADGKRFADALRDAGHAHTAQYMIPDRDHFSIVELKEENPARSLLLQFIGVKPLSARLEQWTRFKSVWQNPPYSTEGFWRYEELIRKYPVDARLVARLAAIYGPTKFELLEWHLDEFHAIGLFSYLDAAPRDRVGRGSFLVATNLRHEVQVWRREDIEPYEPVIVVGLDDERNLFRLAMFYRMFREYSWRETGPPPVMVRPVGAFIHFLKEPPPELASKIWHSGFTPESFEVVEDDPLAPLRDLPPPVRTALTHGNGCVYCHALRGVGARSHHTLAATGEAHGGFALALEDYPNEVLRNFIYDQEAVAQKMGATPNLIAEEARAALEQAIRDARAGQRLKEASRSR